jgi:NADPH-dependent F420 reductase
MKISILGTGKMGSAVGCRLAEGGHSVIFGSRSPSDNQAKFADSPNVAVGTYAFAAASSDVVMVAVPWLATLPLLESLATQLSGKVLIDLTNPLAPDISHLTVGGSTSAAEMISEKLPKSHVVKAFNMITADNFPNPRFSGEQAQVFYCSDHEDARNAARAVVSATGYVPMSCGALSNARYLEAMAMLWLQLAFWEDKGDAWTFNVSGRWST